MVFVMHPQYYIEWVSHLHATTCHVLSCSKPVLNGISFKLSDYYLDSMTSSRERFW